MFCIHTEIYKVFVPEINLIFETWSEIPYGVYLIEALKYFTEITMN